MSRACGEHLMQVTDDEATISHRARRRPPLTQTCVPRLAAGTRPRARGHPAAAAADPWHAATADRRYAAPHVKTPAAGSCSEQS